jgi:hypothetical protein
MELNKTEIPILVKPHVNYLGGNTQLYESNKITGGRRRRTKSRKQRRSRRTARKNRANTRRTRYSR